MLQFEDYIYGTGPKYEYINSEKIFRIRFARKRIRIYLGPSSLMYIYVEKNKHNMKELELKMGITEENIW